MLRSCYRARVRFFRDDEAERDVFWYFVADDRKLIPYASMFMSRIYERDDFMEPPIGERYDPVPWYGGSPPCPEPTQGLCGTREQWGDGCSIDDHIPEAWPGTSVPKCCPKPLVGSCGGIGIGGIGVIVGRVPVPFCSGTLSRNLRMTVDNAFCTCMVTLLQFQWNDIDRWICTTGGNDCNGNPWSEWYLEIDPFDDGLRINNSFGGDSGDLQECDPFYETFIGPFPGEPNNCPEGGLWLGAVTEE